MTTNDNNSRYDKFPPFGGLKAFYEVALTGSAVNAAVRLNVTPSSISHQLKSLEGELGVRLIENRKGKLCLTPDGSQYFGQIRGAMGNILDATESLRSTPGRRRVSVTLTPSFAAGWLMPRLLDLDREHSDLEINMITTTRVIDLARENIDLAIRRGSGTWGGLVAEPLLKETIVPVIAPSLCESIDCQDLEHALSNSRALVNTTLENEWENWCAARGVAAPSNDCKYNLETYELTIQAARDGFGVALGRRPLVDSLFDTNELISPFQLPDTDNTGYHIVRRDVEMRSDVRRLYSWLKSQAEQDG